MRQIQEDLPQEKEDNQVDPEGKKAALKAILASYNARYGTNHITAASQELETLKTHKKGLMQQLFPSAEAVAA